MKVFILLVHLLYYYMRVADSVQQQQQQPPFSCPSTNKYPFCKTKLPISHRAKDLVSRLTLDEKVSQLVNTAPAIPRLGIPAYQWWSEALHGVAYISSVPQGIHFNGSITAATSFPQVILSAASFDPLLWYRIGQAVGREARAIYNAGQATGMTFWAPNINIYRDPRWGRGQETPGEDPTLTAKYAVSYVRGIQGDAFNGSSSSYGGENQLQASACCKHFTAYDLDHWKGIDRFIFDAKVTAQDLADTFQPPFYSCIKEGKASGIMCAYNQVNGVPNCADYDLLSNTARRKWSFNGYITSDCDAVAIMFENQTYAKTPEDAVAGVLKAGMDVNCGDYLMKHTKSAVQKKKVLESDIDRALQNLFSVRMRLGLFNGDPTKQPYGNIGPDQACSKEHQDLALEAALHGIVLLKNSHSLLPLAKSKTLSLAVIGPNADVSKTLLGNYAGPPCKTVTPLQGLQSYVSNKRIMYHPGCTSVNCSSASIDQAVNIAKGADQVVLVMGLDQTQEREDYDREHLLLPGNQQKLITRVARAAKKPVVLVLLCGGPVDVSFAKYDNNIGSILWAGYPGEAGGLALGQIVFGDHNPGGRLPVTWYPKDFSKVPMTDMRMRSDPSSGYPGRTYRFYRGPKVFEFGYGLSYSNYSYQIVPVSSNKINFRSTTEQTASTMLVSEIDKEVCKNNKFTVTVRVENQGDMAGKHPVLLFVREPNVVDGRPMKKLVGFQTLNLKPGATAEIEYKLSPCKHFSTANEHGMMVIEQGSRVLVVGDEECLITVVV